MICVMTSLAGPGRVRHRHRGADRRQKTDSPHRVKECDMADEAITECERCGVAVLNPDVHAP